MKYGTLIGRPPERKDYFFARTQTLPGYLERSRPPFTNAPKIVAWVLAGVLLLALVALYST